MCDAFVVSGRQQWGRLFGYVSAHKIHVDDTVACPRTGDLVIYAQRPFARMPYTGSYISSAAGFFGGLWHAVLHFTGVFAIMSGMKRVLFISGEPSGDQHGAHVVRGLKARMPDLDAYGVGGPDMQAEGLRLIHDITELSVIGLVEVAKSYFRLKAVFDDLVRHVDADRPDAVVLIDYPGFNLRLATVLKKKHPNLPIIYFVSPQIWAWGHRRIHLIRRVVDLMLVLFPFEVDVYEKGGRWVMKDGRLSIREHHFWRASRLRVRYVGHPVALKLRTFKPDADFAARHEIPPGKRVITILSGSRPNEVRSIFPVMLRCSQELLRTHDDVFFLVSCARTELRQLLNEQMRAAGIAETTIHYRVVEGSMYDMVNVSELIICKSGTSAFEAALMLKPIFVLYRVNFFTALVAKLVLRIPFFNLANIIAGHMVVPEFIQYQMTPRHILPAVQKYLDDKTMYKRTVDELASVRSQFEHGDTGARAAEEICEFMKWGRGE